MTLFPMFAVKDTTGRTLGTYRAKNERDACNRFKHDQLVTAATFRKSQPFVEIGVRAIMIEDGKGNRL